MASAEQYPIRPIRLLTAEVGGGSDFTARLIAQRLSEKLRQQIVVDNRTGGVIVAAIASKTQPDGYTLLVHSANLWQMPYMRDQIPYSMDQFTAVAHLTASPLVLVVHPQLPVKSVTELIALAKAKPGELNYASGPMGAGPHLAGELFKYMAGVDIAHIPFKGVGMAVNDVIAGRVQVMFSSVGSAVPQARAGRLRALAITAARPSALLPALPTVAASGLPDFECVSTYGLFTPSRTPASIVQRLNRDIEEVLGRPEIQEKFLNVGMESVGGTPAEFERYIKLDSERMGKVIRAAHIRAE